MKVCINSSAISSIKTSGCEDGELGDDYNFTIIDLTNGGRIFVNIGVCIYFTETSIIIER